MMSDLFPDLRQQLGAMPITLKIRLSKEALKKEEADRRFGQPHYGHEAERLEPFQIEAERQGAEQPPELSRTSTRAAWEKLVYDLIMTELRISSSMQSRDLYKRFLRESARSVAVKIVAVLEGRDVE